MKLNKLFSPSRLLGQTTHFSICLLLGVALGGCQGLRTSKSDPALISNSVSQSPTDSITPKSGGSSEDPVVPRGLDYSTALQSFAFGSNADQNLPQPLWKTIQEQNPDLFVFIGNSVIASQENQKSFSEQYNKLDKIPEYRQIREKIPFLAIWNDQDFGSTNGGSDNIRKELARKEFLKYWSYVKDSIALNQGPLYHSKTLGGTTVDKRRRRKFSKTVPSVHFILLDTRWNRDPLHLAQTTGTIETTSLKLPTAVPEATKSEVGAGTVLRSSGPFAATDNPKATLLGETQWEWLEDELKQAADLVVLVTPIQVIANDHGFESWGLFPKERERLFHLISKVRPRNLFILSGDRGFGAVAKTEINAWGPLYEITVGSINRPKSTQKESDRAYLSETFNNENFGLVTLDWKNRSANVELKNAEGKSLNTLEIKLRR